MIRLISIVSLLGFMSCAHHVTDKSDLKKILKAEHRSEENRARDKYRNPVETLAFFEVGPEMNVVEISPGGGWYTEVLAPYLREKGQLTLAINSDKTTNEYRQKLNKTIREKISSAPEVYGDIKYSVFELPDFSGPVAADNSQDRILTFRSAHGFVRSGKINEAFQSFYRALKPGGILGLVQHREAAGVPQDPKAVSGYMSESFIIESALAAGFVLEAQSEINANMLDTRDHPNGVWSLPPALREGDKDREKFLKIGESDRMTLKFKKPL